MPCRQRRQIRILVTVSNEGCAARGSPVQGIAAVSGMKTVTEVSGMKTVTLREEGNGTSVTLELNEFELTTLVALVEEGRKRLGESAATAPLHLRMKVVADEFTSLLGHLELLSADD
jgi:hypothetical protein